MNNMKNDLKKVIESSTLILHPKRYIFAKVKTLPNLDKHFLVAQDSDEITVITAKENIGELNVIEVSGERSLLEIQFSDSFDIPGFLAATCSALSEHGISISAISTFSKDYLLVDFSQTEKAIKSLTDLGISKK